MRLSLLTLLLVGFVSVLQNVKAEEAVFFESLYDVPVMAGLVEVTEMSLSFDKAQGRLAYAAALSEDVEEDEVLSFYSNALAQMGWQELAPNLFLREREKLEISFEKTAEKAVSSRLVKFSLKPYVE